MQLATQSHRVKVASLTAPRSSVARASVRRCMPAPLKAATSSPSVHTFSVATAEPVSLLEQFHEELRNYQVPVLVDFYSKFCGPCIIMDRSLQAITKKYGDKVVVLKISVDEYRRLATASNVHSLPTVLLFQDGEETARISASRSFAKLEAWMLQHIPFVSNDL